MRVRTVKVTATACAIAWLGRDAVWRREGAAAVVAVPPEASEAGAAVLEWACQVYGMGVHVEGAGSEARMSAYVPAAEEERPGDVADRLVAEWRLAGCPDTWREVWE